MQAKAPPRNPILMREERQHKLKTFVERALEARSSQHSEAVLLLTRSIDSIVTRALVGLSAQLAALSMPVRIAIATDIMPPLSSLPAQNGGPYIEIRFGLDHRLLDAHEQLIIGDRALWFGDCMRREPDKIDNFERFLPDDLVANRNGRATFQRLWGSLNPATVVGRRETSPANLASTLSGVSPADLAETLNAWQPLTRH